MRPQQQDACKTARWAGPQPAGDRNWAQHAAHPGTPSPCSKRIIGSVEALFEKFERTDNPQTKGTIARAICLNLSVHTLIEEELFYPAVEDAVDEQISDEAYVEHDGAKVLIAEIEAGTPGDAFYDAKAKVLSEMIKHHVKEEEQRDGMFAQARKGDVDLAALGEAMIERKKELLVFFERRGLPRPTTRVMTGPPPRGANPAA